MYLPMSISKVLFIILLLHTYYFQYAQVNNWNENQYADYIQTLMGGEREVSVQSGRVDLLTPVVAYEIEWANKWKDAVGQAIWYSLQTERQPGIILILRKPKDYKYFIQLNSALVHANLHRKIQVLLFPNDFENLMKN